nr:hypothetical protein [uncultured Rhodopila sp.]
MDNETAAPAAATAANRRPASTHAGWLLRSPGADSAPQSRSAALTPAGLRALLFAAYVALIAIRIPGVLSGRLWAEDGFFLVDAIRLPWWQALLQPHTGYLDIVASGTMVLAARLVALEDAPLVSLTLSLCIQALPGLILATGGIRSMRNPWYLAGALLILATLPLAEEVWLSPITSQYHLIVAVALVLAAEPARGWTRRLHRMVLLLAPFAGPGPSLLLPLFVLRAMRECCWERVGQALAISLGTLVQMAVLLSHPVAQRDFGLAPDLLLVVVAIKHILVPMLFRPETIALANPLMRAWLDNPWSAWPLLAMAGSIGVLTVFGAAAWHSRSQAASWLFAAAVVTMVLSYAGSLGPKDALLGILFGQRYYAAPQMLFGLTLIAIASAASLPGRLLAGGFAVWLIAIGIAGFGPPDPMMANGPDWREQVAAWRSDPGHRLALWPSNFTIALPAAPARADAQLALATANQ